MGINWQELWEKLRGDSTTLIINIVVSALAFLAASLLLKALTRHTERAIKRAQHMGDRDKGKELVTVMTTLRSVARYILYFIALLVALNQFGLGSSVNNILVTAGIGSLMITLGAQSIIKDFVSGLLMLFERQFSVGDYVTIGAFSGVVTSVGMRVTCLKTLEGEKIIIPNGSITTVTNYGNEATPYTVTVSIPSAQSYEKIAALLAQACAECTKNHRQLFPIEPEVLGITALTAGRMEITLRANSPAQQLLEAKRELTAAVKSILDRENIII